MMKRYVFDIETDGLYDATTKIHSLVLGDVDTGEIISCTDNGIGYQPVHSGLQLLAEADEIIGHNIICFDIPVIRKLFPDFNPKGKVTDTLVCSRLIWPDMRDTDFGYKRKHPEFPGNLIGSHSLKAWGYRLKDNKDVFGETTDWKDWSEEMQTYCEQDVKVTLRLFNLIESKQYSMEALALEHQFATIIQRQEHHGILFDTQKAGVLYAELVAKRDAINDELQKVFPPKDEGCAWTPKVNNKAKGYVKGKAIWKEKIVPFNPGSRDHIAERLKERYGWTPTVFTDKGTPQIDDEVLHKLEYPEAKLLTEYLMLQKRISQIAIGEQAWLKCVGSDGIIHGSVTTNGAVTGRCTHHHPNLAQVPAVGAPYGDRCRELFYAPEGYVMLGADASGLELRCLSHYLTKYDGGSYRDVVLNGDIHTANQQAAGLATRAEAKKFVYSFLYGAGDAFIGSLLLPDASEAEQQKHGSTVKKQFLKQTPALASLIRDVQFAVKQNGHLRGLDGRILTSRSVHSALNLLLQSAGAIVMKKATCILWEDLEAAGFEYGSDVVQVLHIHDEYQLYVRKGLESQVGEIAVNAIRKAGDYFKFRCPLDGEYKVGANWKETH